MIFLLLFPLLQYIDASFYHPDNQKVQILLFLDSPLCSNCLKQMDSILIDLDTVKFNYIVVPNESNDFFKRKITVENLKLKIKARKYLFFKDKSDYLKFCELNKIKYFPTLVIIKNDELNVLKYEDIFGNSEDNINNKELILKIINQMNK